jgi:two-component system cell cycle sensor histidine kinase/response regulator CckA
VQNNQIPSSALYKTLVDNVRDVITLIDEKGTIKFQSPSFERQFGYSPDELIGSSVFELIHEEDIPEALEALQETTNSTESSLPLIIRFLHKDRTWRYIEVAGQMLTGEFPGLVLITRDITGQQEIQNALRQSEQSFQAAFNATSAVSAITIPETGEFLDVNKAWVEYVGWSRDEAIGKTALDLNVWGSEENRDQIIKELTEKGRLKQFKSNLYTRSGERRIVLLDAEYMHENDQPKMFISGIDITEREEIEEQLRQSQKLESIGQLTGGIAHDFNNLLSIIMGHAELASIDAENNRDVRPSLAAVQRSAETGAKLIQQLLAFSRKQKLSPESFNLGNHITLMRPLLATTLGKHIGLNIEADDDGWQCHLDPIQFESAVLNMAINSRDAMPEGGELNFTITNTNLNLKQARRRDLQAGDYLKLNITDNGIGMTPETIGHAFEPFFTTKQSSGGTGLGLSMVFGFTKQSGGHISIFSNKRDQGTTISLLLPCKKERKQATTEHIGHIQEQHNKQVLLVEDNNEVRVLISMLLSSLKLEVVEASSGDEVDKLKDQSFDLLVSDVMLPGDLKGPDIARRLRTKHPGLAVLYMSGFQQGMLSADDLTPEKVAFIQKPFTRKDFSAKIEMLLDD